MFRNVADYSMGYTPSLDVGAQLTRHPMAKQKARHTPAINRMYEGGMSIQLINYKR